MHDTISCLLCHGVVGFTKDDSSRYENHLTLEHRVFYAIPWIITKTVEEFDTLADKKPYLAATTEEDDDDASVSVSITNLATGQLVSMAEANIDNDNVEEEVNNVLDSMNTEEFLEEDTDQVVDNDPLDETATMEDGQDESVEPKKEGKFKCDECGVTTKTEKKLQKHMKITHGGKAKPYKCSFCQKAFKGKAYMETHKKSHGIDDESGKEEKKFPCEQCGKSFKTEWYVKTHQKSHTTA